MQTHVGWNQMEPHMSDPTTRNTETRPDIWIHLKVRCHNHRPDQHMARYVRCARSEYQGTTDSVLQSVDQLRTADLATQSRSPTISV